MIPDKDIRPESVFEGLVDHQKIVVEKVIDNHYGIKYVMFRDEKGNKHQVSYEMFKRCNLKEVVKECGS